MCRLSYGKYIGVKLEHFNVPLSMTDLCFYVPDLDDGCLKSTYFLCYGNSGCDDEQMCYTHCQHKREDVIFDDELRQQRITNFRMMPPDAERDPAFAIRLYNNTVVWLMTGSCYANSSVLSDIWKPTRYILDEYTRSTSFPLTPSAEGTISSCLVTYKR